MLPPTTYSFVYIDNLLTRVSNPTTLNDYPGHSTLVKTKDGKVSTLAQYRSAQYRRNKSRRKSKKASDGYSTEKVETEDPDPSYQYSTGLYNMKAAMLSGTTLGANVTPNEDDASRIDTTQKSDEVSEQIAPSKTEQKRTLTSTVKGLFNRH